MNFHQAGRANAAAVDMITGFAVSMKATAALLIDTGNSTHMEAHMKRAFTTRLLLASTTAVAALVGSAAAAAPASAANWNVPRNIRYPFFPECTTHMSPFYAGYGTMTCEGEYRVNRGNYMFTQDNTHTCPVLGKLQRITLDYVLNPANGGVTTTRVLAGFTMHW